MADPRLEALGIIDVNREGDDVYERDGKRYVQGLWGEIEIDNPRHAFALNMLTAYQMGMKDGERRERVSRLLAAEGIGDG